MARFALYVQCNIKIYTKFSSMISTCQTNMIYVWIQMKSQHLRLGFPSSSSSFFFFFFLMHTNYTVQETLCTVHGTHNHFIYNKNILKIGLTTLFTHLKLILLQYFQFSFFSKISCIQTYISFRFYS